MRMLKRTSKHHQPAHLAAAVALGIVVGLVPKANLLAIGLYAALLLLPIHTLLALAVSMVVAFAAGYLDPMTHALGSWLLRQEMLRPLWYWLDNTAVLPWLGLHNTVVLGSLVSGVTAAAPAYLVALRLFERMRWNATTRRVDEPEESLFLAPQPVRAANVPPPKLLDMPQPAAVPAIVERSPTSTEEDEFEPVREVAGIINSWHMGHASKKTVQPHILSALSSPIAHASPDPIPPSRSSKHRDDGASDEGFRPRSFVPPPRPWSGERSEIVDSLDLAHNASETLDWVDGMLNECLSEDSTPIIQVDVHPSPAAPARNSYPVQEEPLREDDVQQEHWLMETTIEVVRWGDDSPPIVPPTVTPKTSHGLPSEAHWTASSPLGQPSLSETSMLNPAQPKSPGLPSRSSDANRPSSNAVLGTPPSMGSLAAANGQTKSPAQPGSQAYAPMADEPPRSECLGFLLGHLRQEREGKSS